MKALYEGWQDVSAVQAAEKLEVSRMSITRCYDEIEALGMSFIKMNGRSRRYVTYAVEKNQISELGLKSIHEVPNNEEPVCIVQEVGYILPFKDKKAVDPLSLSLMLSDADMEDPRVENCLNEMLEELIW